MKVRSLDIDNLRSVEWLDEKKVLKLIDQRLLPFKLTFVELATTQEVASAIRNMIVRGAPAIGATAAYAMVIAFQEVQNYSSEQKQIKLEQKFQMLVSSRPTAVDLRNCAYKVYQAGINEDCSPTAALEVAHSLVEQMIQECKKIGEEGVKLIKDGDSILTHCNAGALATIDYGTALAPIRKAHEMGKSITVYATETRPRLQGARLTAWELDQEGIKHFVIPDTAVGFFMDRGEIDKVILGTDRCFKDGSIINKIGTLQLAIMANYFHIPFYPAFPASTLDLEAKEKDYEVIEFRDENEVKQLSYLGKETPVVNPNSPALNPAFDLTPNNLISSYITPKGVLSLFELQKWFDALQTSTS